MEIFAGTPVYLRPLEFEHVQTALRWFQDYPTALLTLRWDLPLNTLEEQKRWLDNMRSSDAHYVFAVYEAQTRSHAGNVGLHNLDPKDRSGELGIFLLEDFQGRGLGTWAIRKALLWAFGVRNLHRVSLRSWSFNSRARRTYQKLGFVHEGTLREANWLDGRYWDVELWGMLEGEWRERFPQDRLGAG